MRHNAISIAIILVTIFFVSNSVLALENKIYLLSLHYDQDSIELNEISVKTGYAPDRRVQPELGYKTELISFTEEVLYSFRFESSVLECSDTFDPETEEMSGECVQLEEGNIILLIPYFEDGKTINIYDSDGNHVLSVDVSKFNCGNGLCELDYDENYITCSRDCPSGSADNYCDGIRDGICDPDCTIEGDTDCITEPPYSLYVVIIVGLVLIILISYFRLKRKGY